MCCVFCKQGLSTDPANHVRIMKKANMHSKIF